MQAMMAESPVLQSPLEDFLRDYVETIGGVWDEVEPQVYDLLLPADEKTSRLDADARGMMRLAFDPEAIPEHPGSQLASFGTPLVDRFLGDALARGRFAEFHVLGLNLTPHDLAGRVRRALILPAEVKPRIAGARPLVFPQAIFWFEAAFVCDQKEQEVVPVAFDLHYGRQVRHLEQLLDSSRFADEPSLPLAEARGSSPAAVYPAARERALRTIATMANVRNRELLERLDRQVGRMTRYYSDLRSEVADQVTRAKTRKEDESKFAGRLAALEREERLRVSELRQKGTLRVQMRLLQLLVLHQPKLLLQVEFLSNQEEFQPQELVYDPLTEAVEAFPCSLCGKPTLELALARSHELVCRACSTSSISVMTGKRPKK